MYRSSSTVHVYRSVLCFVVMMAITAEDYESKYWPELENAIDQLLRVIPGQYLSVSYEQVYRFVLKLFV